MIDCQSHPRYKKVELPGRPLWLILATLICCSSSGSDDGENISWTEGVPLLYQCEYCIAMSSPTHLYALSGDSLGRFQGLRINNDHWDDLPPLPLPRTFPGGTILGDDLYVAGGIDGDRMYSARVDRFSIDEQVWTELPSLSKPRSRLVLVTVGQRLYAIGGLEGKNDKEYRNSSLVEEYDPVLNTWRERNGLPTPRHGLSAIAINGRILAVGGYADSGAVNVVEEYDPVSDRWEQKPSMPTPRGFFGLVQWNEKVIALGGRVPEEQGPVEAYDYKEEEWSTLSPLPFRVNRFGVTTLNNKIYIIGGEERPWGTLIGKHANGSSATP